MKQIVFALLMAVGLWFAVPAPASALSLDDIIDEAIAFYIPDLKPVKPIIKCVISGASVQTCTTQALQANVVTPAQAQMMESGGSTVQQVIELATLIKEDKYHQVIAKAGVVFACAVMQIPAKDVVCGDIAGKLAEAGAAALNATTTVASAAAQKLAEFFADVGEELVCLVSSCPGGSGTKLTVDGARVWKDCYVARINEGVLRRTSGGAGWATLISANINQGLFPEGSLIGNCSNALLIAITQPNPPSLGGMGAWGGNPNPSPFNFGGMGLGAPPISQAAPLQGAAGAAAKGDQAIAEQLRPIHAPMIAEYSKQVESAAVKSLDPLVDDYRALQAVWIERAKAKAADWFLSGAGGGVRTASPGVLTALSPVNLFKRREQQACRTALSTPGAEAITRWAGSGAVVGSQTQLRGRTGQDWTLADAPQPWCQNAFTAAFEASIAARRAAYDEALAGGCVLVDNDPKRMTCAMLTPALGKCVNAFAGASDGGHCTATQHTLTPTGPITPRGPIPGAAPPQSPPATTPAAPSPPPRATTITPRVRIPAPPQTAPTPREWHEKARSIAGAGPLVCANAEAYAASSAIFCAFLIASSMVPTM